MIRTSVLKTLGDFDRVRPLWERLAQTPRASMFQQFHWNRLAAEVFAEREEPHVIVAEDGPDAVILPLCIRRDRTAALIGETLFDYRDLLSSGRRDLELAALSEAASLGLPLEITAINPAAQNHWSFLGLRDFCNAPRVDLEVYSDKAFAEAHPRLLRHGRRMVRAGATRGRRTGNDRAFIRQLYDFKAPLEGNLFADPLRRHFMEELCALEGDRCEVMTYETSDRLVGAMLSFRTPKVQNFYTVYYDPEWGTYSPGQVLMFEMCLDALSQGRNCDLLTGEYPYKNRLASSLRPLYRVQCTAEEFQGAVASQTAQIAA